MKQTITGYGLRIVLDSSEIFPDDPGQGTPAMVYVVDRHASATYWCALNEGEIEDVQLTTTQSNWLELQENNVSEFIDKYTALIQEIRN